MTPVLHDVVRLRGKTRLHSLLLMYTYMEALHKHKYISGATT